MKDATLLPDDWEFGMIYKSQTKEACVRASKKARNEGFRVDFCKTDDPDYPYGFILVDPFEYMYPEDWA